MSSIVGIFGYPESLRSSTTVKSMASRIPARGLDRSGSHDEPANAATLAVFRFDWEADREFSGEVEVLVENGLAVAADAAIYYREDLIASLGAAGVEPRGATPSHLIAAAFRAWGAACAERLEGDFAFAVRDSRTGQVICARSLDGHRPLYYSESSGKLLVASTISALVEHPGCSRELNIEAIAEDAAGLNGSPTETCYRAVQRLPAGCTLQWTAQKGVRVSRHWSPPVFRDNSPSGSSGFREAAEELRELLIRAVGERLSKSGPSSVWLSGGRDSSAVYGAGQTFLRRKSSELPLLATSVSYPQGDPGREDEFIQQIADFWGTTVRWVDSTEVRIFAGLLERAARRDEPFPHPFETLLRALAERDKADRVRVSLDGAGGDQLFMSPDSFYSDLLVRGRWLRLFREWRQGPNSGMSDFYQVALFPSLPDTIRDGLWWLGVGRDITIGRWVRIVPNWIVPRFQGRKGLPRRERGNVPKRGSRSHASYYAHWLLVSPRMIQTNLNLANYALEAGAEHRSPFYDRRLIDFAASRPRSDRNFAGDTKRLLRAASKTLLPDSVRYSRPYKTGGTSGYLGSEVRSGFAEVVELLLRDSELAKLDIVSPDRVQQAWDEYRRENVHRIAAHLGVTAGVEAWFRSHGAGNKEDLREEDLFFSEAAMGSAA